MAEYIECVKGSSYSANIVDENNVFLGWDNEKCCCESFEVNANYESGDLIDVKKIPKSYVFDVFYIKRIECKSSGDERDNTVEFKLYDEKYKEDDIFIRISNCHNGFYSHGFEFGIINGETIESGSI